MSLGIGSRPRWEHKLKCHDVSDTKLKAQMDQTDKVSTENLRFTPRRYRLFFERLLSL